RGAGRDRVSDDRAVSDRVWAVPRAHPEEPRDLPGGGRRAGRGGGIDEADDRVLLAADALVGARAREHRGGADGPRRPAPLAADAEVVGAAVRRRRDRPGRAGAAALRARGRAGDVLLLVSRGRLEELHG